MTYAGQTTIKNLVKVLKKSNVYMATREEAIRKKQKLILCYDKYLRETAYAEFSYICDEEIIEDAFWNKELTVLAIWDYSKRIMSYKNKDYILN